MIALIAARWFTGARNLAGIASGASAMVKALRDPDHVLGRNLAEDHELRVLLFRRGVSGGPEWLKA